MSGNWRNGHEFAGFAELDVGTEVGHHSRRSRSLPHFRRRVPGSAVTSSSRFAVVSICGSFLLAALCAGRPVAAQSPKEPETVVLSGSPLGAVTLQHKAHTKDRGAKCEQCHHPSKAEKPLKSDHQKCTDCHTKAATPPMKTKLQAAFHDPMAKKGTCVDCHVQAAAKGKKVPAKCQDCHKKA